MKIKISFKDMGTILLLKQNDCAACEKDGAGCSDQDEEICWSRARELFIYIRIFVEEYLGKKK